MKLHAIVKRGKAIGTTLVPHRFDDGCYVVSLTRFKRDYIRVRSEADLPVWVAKGYSIRMSNPLIPEHKAASLIAPASIHVI